MDKTLPQRMSTGEFIALTAMLFSTIAFSIDALIPAYPQIEADLATGGQVHMIITMFMIGLGFGTLVTGPISDALGRKPVMYIGATTYIVSGLVAWLSQDFEIVIIARLFQGIGAAGPRVVGLAVVRDLYKGREMARIVSLAMLIFTIVPTLAPAMGAQLANAYGWRAILLAFVLFSAISTLWLMLRLNEPLPKENRRPLRLSKLASATLEVMQHPIVRLAIFTQSASMALIFCLIVQVQPIYDVIFDRAESFPYWFGGIALVSATTTSFVNSILVMKLGMRLLVTLGMIGQLVSAAGALAVSTWIPEYAFYAFVVWQFMVIFLSGLCIGNLNAIALEPMGHIAGLTASVTGAVSTLLAAAASGVVGSVFNGTTLPLLTSCAIMACAGLIFMWRMNSLSRSEAYQTS